jgi:hypothetical protein
MHPPDGPLAPLPGAEILCRILPPRPVSAHAAHRVQKRMAFRLLPPRGTLAEMEDGGVEGINSVYYKSGARTLQLPTSHPRFD